MVLSDVPLTVALPLRAKQLGTQMLVLTMLVVLVALLELE
jgi:hypothetical protein